MNNTSTNPNSRIGSLPTGEGGGRGRLSEHFELEEFVRSSTADKLGICNEAPEYVAINLQVLCQMILEPLRRMAEKPLHINSGFRCSALNMAVGGAKNSNHLFGFAADIRCESWEECKEWQWLVCTYCDFDECICEKHGKSVWLHVAYRNNMPQRYRAFCIEK